MGSAEVVAEELEGFARCDARVCCTERFYGCARLVCPVRASTVLGCAGVGEVFGCADVGDPIGVVGYAAVGSNKCLD